MSDASPFDDPKVIAALDAPLDKKLTAQRDAFDGKGTKLTYLEGHAAIAQLNRLFDFDGWGYTVDAQGVDEYTDGPVEDWYAQFWAIVTLTVRGAPPRQDVGASEVQNRKYTDKRTGEVKVNNNVRKVDARSTARKGAVTDALKRAFRTFGQQGGNGLYDTDNDVYAWMVTHGVADEATPAQEQPARQPAARPTPSPARTAATPAQERPATIRDLAATIPDTRTLAREETQARAADGQVVMERRRDGTVALNNVPLGEDGTAMFEALRKAMTLDALGKEWTAVVANRTALSAPQLDILIRWKENRKVELEQPAAVR